MNISVLFENDEYICVDKPALVLTVPARLGENETRPVLGHLLEKQLGIRMWPIHRLDEPVSGAVLFAKSARAHSTANAWFEKNLIGKTYEAYSLKEPKTPIDAKAQDSKKQESTISSPELKQPSYDLTIPELGKEMLWQSKLLRGKKRAYMDETRGKLAITQAKLVAETGAYYYWHLSPKTGRSHQLRFELYRHHYPILGDVLYGGAAWPGPGIALRNLVLDFKDCPEAKGLGLPPCIVSSPLEKPQ